MALSQTALIELKCRQERTKLNELKCQGRIHLYAASTHVRPRKITENIELTLNEKEKNANKRGK